MAESSDATEPQRQAALEAELHTLRTVNSALREAITSLQHAQAGAHRLHSASASAGALLDAWTRILGQTEHTQRLLLNPEWKGASDDVLEREREEERARSEDERERRRIAEERERRERERRSREDEGPATSVRAPRGRGGLGRARVALAGAGRGAGPRSTSAAGTATGTGTGPRGATASAVRRTTTPAGPTRGRGRA